MTTARHAILDIQHRQTSTLFESTGSRTKSALLATDDPVEVFDRRRRTIIREVLRMDGLSVPASVPLLCDHNRSTKTTIGTARDFSIDGGELHGQLHFASDTQSSDEVWTLAQQGHLRSVSVGYRTIDSVFIPAGKSQTVKGRRYNGPVKVTTRWSLHEISVVTIGADPKAGFRSLSLQDEDNHMSATPAPTQEDTRHLRLIDYARSYVAGRGQRVPDDDRELLRSWASFDGLDDLTGQLGSWLVAGYDAQADSTAGLVSVQPLPNYLTQRLGTVSQPVQPQRMARGGQAPPTVLASQYEEWSLFKVGVSFTIDEQDLLDSADSLDVWATAMREVGAAFRRVVLDSVWGLILSNPTLADGNDLFSTANGNLGTAAFATDAFSTAWTAIANATRATSVEGANAHENLAPQYLVVSPSNTVNAVNVVSAISDAAPLVRVRSESRLGSDGFLDPRDDTIRSGNGDNWLLACPSGQAPSVILGFLGGRREPRFQSYELTQGQWGLGFDADLSLGVTAVSGNGCYWSSGTA